MLEQLVNETPVAPPLRARLRRTGSSSSLVRGGVWVVAGRFLAIVSNVVTNAVLARYLSPADLGIFFVLRNAWALGGIFAMFGLDAVLVRTVGESLGAGNVARARHVLWLSVSIVLASILIAGIATTLVLIWWGKQLSGIPDGYLLPLLSGASVMLLGSTQLLAETHRSLNHLKVASFLAGQGGGAVTSIFCLGMFITFVAIWPAGLVVAVVANCLALFFAAIIALATIGRSARQEFAVVASQSHAHPPDHPVVALPPIVTPAFIATCASVLVMQLLSYVIVQSDQLLGGLSIAAPNSAFSLDDSALYGTARRVVLLVGLPMDLLNLTIAATIPRLYARRDILGLQALLRRTTRLAGLPTMVALLALFAAPRLFLEIYFGAKYGAAATLVVILSLGVLVQSWCGACEIVLVMTGHQGIVLRINGFLATGFVVCAYLAALKFGAVGLAIVAAVTLILQRLLLWYFAHRAVGVWTNFSLPWRLADLRATFRRTH